jgi:hypothetical protein
MTSNDSGTLARRTSTAGGPATSRLSVPSSQTMSASAASWMPPTSEWSRPLIK